MVRLATGVVHTIPTDMRAAISSDNAIVGIWNNLTPLARNAWICWTISVKRLETRTDHLRRMKEDLIKGKRRPCCFAGCPHRTH